MKWISVNEKLPETDDEGYSPWFLGRVQVKNGNKRGATMPIRIDKHKFVWVESGRQIGNDFEVTHWMPLPKSPKE